MIDREHNELLNQDDFEKYIAVGTSVDDLKAIFLADNTDLDYFCRQTYHLDFMTVYGLISKRALAEYKSCLSGLAGAGNATAINTMNQIILNMTQNQNLSINVSCNIPEDDEK